MNQKYEFDYYKFKDYNNNVDCDLINEYLKENVNNDELINMSQKMKNECISNKNIQLFILLNFVF